jgi:hypothetical protein
MASTTGDLYILPAPFDDQVRAVRRELCQLFLHFAALAVHRFGQVSWKMHLVGVVGEYNQRNIAQGPKRSDLRGIFVLSGGLSPHRCNGPVAGKRLRKTQAGPRPEPIAAPEGEASRWAT